MPAVFAPRSTLIEERPDPGMYVTLSEVDTLLGPGFLGLRSLLLAGEIRMTKVDSVRGRTNPHHVARRKMHFDHRSERDARKPFSQPREWILKNIRER
jgi:hypothetical protein